ENVGAWSRRDIVCGGAPARERSESAVRAGAPTSRHGRLPSVAGRGTHHDDAFEITAMSCATYPLVKDRYAITGCGSSMGEGYGPKIIALKKLALDDLRSGDIVIAIPGEHTTA